MFIEAQNCLIINRRNRFLVDIEIENNIHVAHMANTGSLKTVFSKGQQGRVVYAPAPTRKLDYQVVFLQSQGVWVNVNTAWGNRLMEEMIDNRLLAPFQGVTAWKREVRFGEKTRFDFQVWWGEETAFVEVKTAQMMRQAGLVEFPDSVTTRGTKHWEELIRAKQQGMRAILCFCVGRQDAYALTLAHDIDPIYGEAARRAVEAGVEVYVYKCDVSEDEISIKSSIDFKLY